MLYIILTKQSYKTILPAAGLFVVGVLSAESFLDWTPEDLANVGESEVSSLRDDFNVKNSLKVFEPEQ